jgi:hypothetical protein
VALDGAAEVFEHLDADARRVVDVALAAAHELGHGWLGTEHVLLGSLAHRELLPSSAQALLPDAAAVRRRLTESIRTTGATASDDVLLASLGIDVAEVRRRAVEVFGADAVKRAATRVRGGERRGSRRRRRRCERVPRCMTVLPGQALGMAPRLKRALEQAHKASTRSGDPLVTPTVLLGAVLGIEDGLACELLVCMGIDVRRVREALGS